MFRNVAAIIKVKGLILHRILSIFGLSMKYQEIIKTIIIYSFTCSTFQKCTVL